MKKFIILPTLCLSLLAIISCDREIDSGRVIANPIDIDYAFTHHHQAGGREAADPVVELFNGRYYLFPSMSYGYWSSEDMKDWKFITNDLMPFGNYAPAIMVYKGELYWTVSGHNKIYKTANPEDGASWTVVAEEMQPFVDEPGRTVHDPYLFADDDDRVYLYWGCSQADPIMGVELDPDHGFKAKASPVPLIGHNEREYGWECRGDRNELSEPSSNEGAAMSKYEGRYYLQYAAPGTEYDTYGDGVYVGDSPLGPFTHCPESPFSVKPGGWMTGAGHGDTFQDKYGNWWHTASTVISQRFLFERRIGFYPVIFTPEGNIHALTEYSDWPFLIPDRKVDWTRESPWTGWMDISIGKEVSVSSQKEGHPAWSAADNSVKTWWSAATGEAGEWISIDLGKVCRVNAVQVNFADEGFGMFEAGKDKSPYRYVLEASRNGSSWEIISDKTLNITTRPHELVVLGKAVKARYVRLTNKEPLTGCLSMFDLRVFGRAPGKAPASVEGIKVDRKEDRRRIEVTWPEAKGAVGYVLRWGTSPDELYSTCQTSEPRKELGLFSTGEKYWFTVDAFNESGITPGREVRSCP